MLIQSISFAPAIAYLHDTFCLLSVRFVIVYLQIVYSQIVYSQIVYLQFKNYYFRSVRKRSRSHGKLSVSPKRLKSLPQNQSEKEEEHRIASKERSQSARRLSPKRCLNSSITISYYILSLLIITV